MNIDSIIIEVADPAQVATAEHFYRDAMGLDERIGVRVAAAASSGFRGFAPSLILEQPADVDAVAGRAIEAGAQVVKPVAKSLWGYGGSLRAPDGTVWQVASANKTNTGAPTGQIERLVLLLGVDDVKASKRSYEQHGVAVGKSFGGKYVEFVSGPVTLALYKRTGLAKQVGVDPAGTGTHRLAIVAEESFTDSDGYVWLDGAGHREGARHVS